ncbi:hypothetical protein N0V93_006082 [Gnomoniopsis smithogilvyi]|uniref:Heterokaryon incompatibility domain-containing protein n=1 Tax=Gnomoniopsis smithogilvyi TaxID=1191159 RepID=A0A9W9CU64_9PEZI|nr:hypothetical protein N0V93_006082 [Gnomoniopsis smithogilvyi]
MKPDYVYDRLDRFHDDSLRILELHPGETDAPIVCSLVQSRLSKQPAYEAISYVWGSAKKDHYIHCDGMTIPITCNLQEALRHVRLADRPRAVWADSICIDQNNAVEKSHQVEAMGKIYSGASRVLIHLGMNDNGHGADAVSLLQAVSLMVAKTLPGCGTVRDSFPYPDENDPLVLDERWSSVDAMLKQEWFHRGWVVQEAALAKDAVVLWGNSECSWADTLRAFVWITTRGLKLWSRLADPGDLHWLLHVHAHPAEYLSMFPGKFDINRTLHPLAALSGARSFVLGDGRDRIFAFREIISRLSSTEIRITPDYRKNRDEVYVDFASQYIEATQKLNLLRYVHHTENSIHGQTPSWVPLWDSSEWEYWDLPGACELPPGHNLPKPYFKLYQATHTLEIQGMMLDTISMISEPFVNDLSLDGVSGLWLETLQAGSGVYPQGDTMRMFLRTLCLGGHVGTMPKWVQTETDYLSLMHEAHHSLKINRAEAAEVGFTSHQPQQALHTEDTRMVQDIINKDCRWRRLIVTQRGYYGLAPQWTDETDICVILPGVGVPFILRKTHNPTQYKVIGEVYITGTHAVKDPATGRVWTQIAAGRSEDWVDLDLVEDTISLL